MKEYTVFATAIITIAIKVNANNVDEAEEAAAKKFSGITDLEGGTIGLKDPTQGYLTTVDTEDNDIVFNYAQEVTNG